VARFIWVHYSSTYPFDIINRTHSVTMAEILRLSHLSSLHVASEGCSGSGAVDNPPDNNANKHKNNSKLSAGSLTANQVLPMIINHTLRKCM
jgi:hypothetical protein